jgi:origin recognition complex subunit 3
MSRNRLSPQTFFDLHFEPDIMVGPAALDFLTDFFCRNSASVEGVLTTLQLAHLKHFDEPLTILVRDERLDVPSAKHAIEKLSDPKAAAFLASLFSWAFGPPQALATSNETGWPATANDVAGLLASVADARADFRVSLRRLKLAFGVMRNVRKTMLDLGYRGAGSDKTPLEMMSASLRGGLAREGKYLGMMTRSAMSLFFFYYFYAIPPPKPDRFCGAQQLRSAGGTHAHAGNCPAKSSRPYYGNCARSSTRSRIT